MNSFIIPASIGTLMSGVVILLLFNDVNWFAITSVIGIVLAFIGLVIEVVE